MLRNSGRGPHFDLESREKCNLKFIESEPRSSHQALTDSIAQIGPRGEQKYVPGSLRER